jgi:hypothetical protein
VALCEVLDKFNEKEHEMRHAEPQFLIDYREWMKVGPPKCCHTCEHYGVDGLCVEFFMKPPAEFANAVELCPSWEAECPF